MAPSPPSTTSSPQPLEPRFIKRQLAEDTALAPTESPAPVIIMSTTVVAPTSSSTPSLTKTKGSKPNVGAIVGGVIGGLAFLAVLSVGIWFWLKRRGNRGGRVTGSRAMEEVSGSNHRRMLSDVPLLGDQSVGRSTMTGSPAGTSGRYDPEITCEPFQPPVSLSRDGYSAVGADDPSSSFLHITPLAPFQQTPTFNHTPPSATSLETTKPQPVVLRDSSLLSPITNSNGGANLSRNPSVATTESMYSLPSADHATSPPFEIPPVPPIPAQFQSQQFQIPPLIPSRRVEQPKSPDIDDAAVGMALRDRAKRSPPRQFTQISEIERNGSINSMSSLTSADQAELRRIKSRAKGKQRSLTMDTLSEANSESPIDPIIPEISPRKIGHPRSTDNLLLIGVQNPTMSPRIVDVEERLRAAEEEQQREIVEDAAREKRSTNDFILPSLPDFESLRIGSPSPRSSRRGSNPSAPQPHAGVVGDSAGLLFPGQQRKGTNDTMDSDHTVVPPPAPLDPNSPTPVYKASQSPAPLTPPLFFLQDVAESESDPDQTDISRSTTATGSTSTSTVLRNSNPFKSMAPEDLAVMKIAVNMSPPPPLTEVSAVVASPTVSLVPRQRQKSVLPSVYPAPQRLSDQSARTLVATPKPEDEHKNGHKKGQESISSSMRPSKPGHDKTSSDEQSVNTIPAPVSEVPSALRPSRPDRSRDRQPSLPTQPTSASTPTAQVAAIPASLRPTTRPSNGPTRGGAAPTRLGPTPSIGGPRNRAVVVNVGQARQSSLMSDMEGAGVPTSLRVGSGVAGM